MRTPIKIYSHKKSFCRTYSLLVIPAMTVIQCKKTFFHFLAGKRVLWTSFGCSYDQID